MLLKAFLQEFVCFIQHKHPNAVCGHYVGLYQLFYSTFKRSNQPLVEYKFLITFLLSLNKTSWKVSYTFIYICIKLINYVHVLPISNISISAMENTQSCIRSKSLNNSEIHHLNIINSIQNIVINCIY